MSRTLTRSPCLDAALEYQRRGWAALPLCPPDHKNCSQKHKETCKRPGKVPLVREWQNRTLSFDELTTVFSTHPTANIGVAMGPRSGLCGLDIDGEAGEAALARMSGGDLPPTLEFATRHGRRLLYAWPSDWTPPNEHIDLDGGEVRFLSAGRQTVMPPSLHADGGEYLWVESCRPGECDLAPVPQWLRALLENPNGRSDVPLPEGHADLPPQARQGDDHQPRAGGRVGDDHVARPGAGDRLRPSAEDRARKYLSRVEPCDPRPEHPMDASSHLLKAADAVAVGFDLLDTTACEILMEWDRQNPSPYPAKEVMRKIAQARQHSTRERGSLLNEPRKSEQKAGSPPPGKPPSGTSAGEDPGETPIRRRCATSGDLIRAGSKVEWLWKGWIPKGMIIGFVASPSCGKTRLCMDIARRIYHGLPWPDGQPATLPALSKTLWVASDNQHPELATMPEEYGINPESVLVNAPWDDPYIGTMLQTGEDLAAFRANIEQEKPALAFVDTSSHATFLSISKPEEATKFFSPLAAIARETSVPIILVTHLNANGVALNRTIERAVRVMWGLTRPDKTDERRRLDCLAIRSMKAPRPLGVTMTTNGNEYDDAPPVDPDEGEAGSTSGRSKVEEAKDWLRERLPALVGMIRTQADAAGISIGSLFRARDQLGVVEDGEKGRKMWSIPPS